MVKLRGSVSCVVSVSGHLFVLPCLTVIQGTLPHACASANVRESQSAQYTNCVCATLCRHLKPPGNAHFVQLVGVCACQ